MIEKILDRLDKVRRMSDGQFMARCPAHDDGSPSLQVTDAGDKITMHCYAGCYTEDIIAALGLEWSDLFSGDEFDIARERAFAEKKKLPDLDPVRVEENIVLIAIQDVEEGKELSREDTARVTLAVERLEALQDG